VSHETKSIRIPISVYKRMKIEAARRGVFIGKIIEEAVVAYFDKRKVLAARTD